MTSGEDTIMPIAVIMKDEVYKWKGKARIISSTGAELSGTSLKNARFYNLIAGIYDWTIAFFIMPLMFHTRYSKHIMELRTMLQGLPYTSVLDIACGSGTIIDYLSPDRNYIGVDVSAELLFKAESRLANKESKQYLLVEGPAEELPMKNNSVELVICSLALHFFYDLEQVIHEINRVIKPDGTFIGSIPVVGRYPVTDFLWKLLSRFSLKFGRPYSEEELKAIIEQCGLNYKKDGSNGRLIYFSAQKV